MFHRLHKVGTKPKGQGSISSKRFREIILEIGVDNFLSPEEWMDCSNSNKNTNKKYCITFDDGLKSQFEIALPILEEFGLKAFWFIYTKTFTSSFDRNEIANYLIVNKFGNIDKFLPIFKIFTQSNIIADNKDKFEIYKNYLKQNFIFYSDKDIEYRYLRNNLASLDEFNLIIDKILLKENLELDKIGHELWMNETNINILVNNGHEIGLHSHSHPFKIASLDKSQQYFEYNKNFEILKKITGVNPKSMSHPLNSFNKNTFKIMKYLNIKCGFCSKIKNYDNDYSSYYKYVLPRVDSSFLIKNTKYLKNLYY